MLIVEDFSKVRVLCVGDVMTDCFVGGAVRRISPESPVPVFSAEKDQVFPGGAANVARNIVALGGSCTLAGVIGDDSRGQELVGDLAAIPGIKTILVVSPDRPTTEKTRFVVNGQHVLRVDREVAAPLLPHIAEQLVARIAAVIDGHDVLVLSDYAKGVLTDTVIQQSIALAQARKIPVIVDPKSSRLARYRGATVITPNAKEIEAATGIDPAKNEAAAAAAEMGRQQAESQAMLVTRAEKGMTLVTEGQPAVHIASAAREVFDVVGAGDTVVATVSLVLGAGGSLENAARLANVAAGIAVGRHGTSTVSRSDLLDELTGSGRTKDAISVEKFLTLDEIVQRVAAWKNDKLKIGFTNGCFDVLHLGHVRLLNFARAECDRLVVGINSDASVRRLKGQTRPINTEADRAEVLTALGAVDAVVVFEEDTPLELIIAVAPDMLVKGADYEIDQIVGAKEVLAGGGRVQRFELVPGKSSTSLIKNAKLERAS